ncbi:MAG: secretion protein HlyD [Clostridiales bacterium]|nr:secretion protein HlyD [Clostridiales bacterium]
MNSTIARRLISLFIALLLLSYIGYQIYKANYSQVRTETAVFATLSDSVQAEGIAVRKETLLTQSGNGVMIYEVEDGGRMSKGGVVASVYSSAEAAAAEQKSKQLKQELAQLTQLNKPDSVQMINPENLDQQVHLHLYDMLMNQSEGNRTGVTEQKQEILSLINQWQIVTGKVENFDARIQSLNSQISSLSSVSGSKTGTVTTSVAGYFIGTADGYENTYSYEDILSISVDDLKREQTSQEVPSNVIGKMCENFDWYIACVVDSETATKLKEGNQITVSMPFATTMEIPARIAAVNQTDKEAEAAVVLQCNYMDASIANVRKETIRLNIETYEGVRVSQKAVHFETITKTVTDEEGKETQVTREVRGVYVLHGNELKFVEIIPIFSSSNYVICKVELEEQEEKDLMTDSTIALYDEVVVGGTDLYDGKIVQ